MMARWQQPEPFRTRVIRHSLAPAEGGNTRNTEQARTGFVPKAYVGVTFWTGLENSFADATAGTSMTLTKGEGGR